MKQLQKSDLKEGEIYKQLEFDYIFLYNKNETSDNFNDGTAISTTAPRYHKRWTGNGFEKPMVEATPEEKHWLETCIKADKFVEYEEAMKTFVPEYVECVNWKSYLTNPSHVEGVVYKILDGGFVELNPKYNLGLPTRYLTHQGSFKPSTKEAYDAQFKEPEFVLPEKWWVRITKENLEDVFKFLGFEPYEKAIGYIAGMCKHYRTGKIEKGWNATPTTDYGSTFGDEITTEQFRKYVLKKEPVVFEEPKDKVLLCSSESYLNAPFNIIKVECSEGGVYKIGDKITVFTKDSPNKGKVFTIKGFRWNNDKSKICAIPELHTPNGIGLDKIELYIEPKVKPKQELSLLEQAKSRYPIGTKFKCVNKNDIMLGREFSIVTDYKQFGGKDSNWGVFCSDNGWIVLHNQWAEIVEDFKLPEKWCIRLNLENVNIVGKWFNENSQTRIYDYHKLTLDSVSTIYNILHYPAYKYLGLTKHGDIINKIENGYTEITFEQFKKYVLKDE